jgi:MFS family permease
LLPFVLLGPLGGAIADRYPRRTVLVIGSLLRLALMLVLAAVVAGHGPVALVIGIVALASAAGSAEKPTTLAALPRLVGEGRIGPANALLHTVQDLAVVVGPAIGALLLAVASAPAAFVANAGTFAVSALLFSRLSDHTAHTAGGHGDRASVMTGVRTARATPFVIPLFVLVAMVELTTALRPSCWSSTRADPWASARAATGFCSQHREPAGSSAPSSTVSSRRVAV